MLHKITTASGLYRTFKEAFEEYPEVEKNTRCLEMYAFGQPICLVLKGDFLYGFFVANRYKKIEHIFDDMVFQALLTQLKTIPRYAYSGLYKDNLVDKAVWSTESTMVTLIENGAVKLGFAEKVGDCDLWAVSGFEGNEALLGVIETKEDAAALVAFLEETLNKLKQTYVETTEDSLETPEGEVEDQESF